MLFFFCACQVDVASRSQRAAGVKTTTVPCVEVFEIACNLLDPRGGGGPAEVDAAVRAACAREGLAVLAA